MTRIDEALRRAHAPTLHEEAATRTRPAAQTATVLEFSDYLSEAVKTPEPDDLVDPVSTELEVMQAISEAMDDLADSEARLRVMRWANALYGRSALPSTTASDLSSIPLMPGAGLPAAAAQDDLLEMSDLEDFFVGAPSAATEDASDFGIDLDAQAPEPSPAASKPVPAAISLTSPTTAKAASGPVPPPDTPAVKPEAVTSMLQSLIDDMKKLAAEWESDEPAK